MSSIQKNSMLSSINNSVYCTMSGVCYRSMAMIGRIVWIHIYRKKHRPITTPWERHPENGVIYQNSIKGLRESIDIGVR